MKRIVIDIETKLDHKTIHLAVTKDIDTEEIKVWKAANGLWDYIADATSLIGHNLIGFDAPILNKSWKTKIGLRNVIDTLILSRLLEPSREHGHKLEAWGKTLGKQKIDYAVRWEELKGRKQAYQGECFDDPPAELLEEYCIGDVEVTAKLFKHLTTELERKGFSQESIDLEHKVAAIIAQQERNGFRLDTAYATVLLVNIKGRRAEVYEAMQQRWPAYEVPRVSEKTGKTLKPLLVTFNPGSRKQIGEKLIELGWKPEKFTETGQPQIDEGVLSKLDMPEAKLIAEYLMLQKRVAQIESWIEAVGEDGRVHGRVITNGAVTGRMTHQSPNMAQIPNTSSVYGKECRDCWTVEEDRVLIGCDLSGIELRCLAHYMQDADWQYELLEGDVHWKNTQAFGLVPMGSIKADSKEHKDARNLSKTICYALLYGAGDKHLGEIAGGGEALGNKLKTNFFKNTPALFELKQKVDRLSSKGFIPGLDGRKVWIRSQHAALNSLLQSAGAIIAKQWLVCLTKNLKEAKIDYKLLACVHDEVCIEGFDKDASRIVEIVVASAREAGEVLKLRCPVGAEGHIGRTWGDVH